MGDHFLGVDVPEAPFKASAAGVGTAVLGVAIMTWAVRGPGAVTLGEMEQIRWVAGALVTMFVGVVLVGLPWLFAWKRRRQPEPSGPLSW